MKIPTVAIIGRPNVGKSTLYNTLAGHHAAITNDEEGTTRDRIFKKVEHPEIDFFLIDTGGIQIGARRETIESDIQTQAGVAMEEADIILFLISHKEGVTGDDMEIAERLRRKGKNRSVILGINKCDHIRYDGEMAPYYQLGLGEPVPLSAAHKNGIDELLGRIIADGKKGHFLTKQDKQYAEAMKGEEEQCQIAVVGRPNVGKSSLINAWLSRERLIVSDVPGTTRDAIDTPILVQKKRYNLIDTAGIRRAGRIRQGVEAFSQVRTRAAIERCDVAALVIDSSEPVSHQDLRIASTILQAKKGLVIVANKWDIGMDEASEEERQKRFIRHLKSKCTFLSWAPLVFTSARTKKNMTQFFSLLSDIHAERRKRVGTPELNRFLQKVIADHPPTGKRAHQPKLTYLTQVGVNPPHFIGFVNRSDRFHFSYARYLENRLRKRFGFVGTSIRLEFKEKKAREKK